MALEEAVQPIPATIKAPEEEVVVVIMEVVVVEAIATTLGEHPEEAVVEGVVQA